ncbi:hypothetical protein [Paraburkholderia youngii]|uniref:hypothetical protein n=1 Tax=Paraburkholderia youngii TaxID=2782701 RepID=UPI003D1FCDEC
MRKYIDTIDPTLPPVTAHAVKYLMAFDHVQELVDQVSEHSRSLREETQHSREAATAISATCAEIHRVIDRHLASLDERDAEYAELRAVLVNQAAALEALEKRLEARLPDPKKVRHEILGDLWQTLEPLVLEFVEKVGCELDARVSEAAARLFEAAARGFMAPARPEEGAPLMVRMRYRRDRWVYRIKKIATDWLAVTQAIVAAALVYLAISQFILNTHHPL